MENVESAVATLKQVLGRLGAGQTLRLRRSGPGGTVEVHARGDGALEVPSVLVGAEDGAPHVLFGRHRAAELAGLLAAAIADLTLVTSSIVDASGVERLLDGSGARSDVTVDGHLDRWDLPMIEQVRRYLSQRFSVPLGAIRSGWTDVVFVPLGRIVQVLHDPPRILVSATVVQGIPGSDELDLALHRLSEHDGLVRLRHHWNRVHAEVVLPAPTFMGQHLSLAFAEIARHSDRLADDIAARHGGEPSYRKRYQPQLSDVLDPDDLTETTDDLTETTDLNDPDDHQEEHP